MSTDQTNLAAVLVLTMSAVVAAEPLAVQSEPNPMHKNRFIGFVVNPAGAGEITALRVTLALMNHPMRCCTDDTGTSCNMNWPCDVDADCSNEAPNLTCAHLPASGPPDLSAFEGKVRYVNSFPGGSLVCPDDGPPFNTSYRCATLGCEPECRDWAADLSVTTNPVAPSGLLYVTGDEVVPSSIYRVSQIAEACGETPGANTCADASTEMTVGTANWGDLTSAGGGPADGQCNVLDCPAISNKMKGVSLFFHEPRTWLKQRDPVPQSDAITVVDFSDSIDGVVARPYPAGRTIDACSHD